MNRFKASDGLEVAYTLDDYADPWRPADTVILVHAAMGSSVRFYAWVPQLARDFRVARIDMRGHGATRLAASDELTVERLAQDVVELADQPRFVRPICGPSSGGWTSIGNSALSFLPSAVTNRAYTFSERLRGGSLGHGSSNW